MSINLEENKSKVRVSRDKTEAYLFLCPPDRGERYSVSDLEEILAKNNVVAGIQRKALQRMLNENSYLQEELVAKTKMAVNGTPGNYEFLFNLEGSGKPKILEDGSVDYSSLKDVEVVQEGDEIVKYTPATKGTDGMDVYGNVLAARAGKELLPLKGKGFIVSQDKRTYKAAVTGKITYKSERLIVSNLLEIDGDVTHATGHIDFNGDVVVKGNVITGMSVRATGNITVNGHVEGSSLYAGKDIVLKNGMQGGGRGQIDCRGNVSGKFFEQTEIYARGNIQANAIMNCNIMSESEIIVSGRLGVIVGGSAHAIQGISATTIGNMSEVKMELIVGVDNDVYMKISDLEADMQPIQDEKKKIEQGIVKIDSILKKQPNPDLQNKKLQLLRAKINAESRLTKVAEKKKKYEKWIEKSEGAKLVVQKSIYRGIKLTINGVQKMIESQNYNVTYCRRGGEIEFYANV